MKKSFVATRLIFLLAVVSQSEAQSLKVDFSNTGGTVHAGYQGYFANHEQPATFTTRSYSAFGTTVGVAPTWAPGAVAEAMQMLDRGAQPYEDATENLMRDWIGTDTRSAGDPLTLTISGLPAGTYTWTSYHHDTAAANMGRFDATVYDANGSTATTGIQITGNAVTTFDGVAKFSTTLVSDGSAITLVFDQQSYANEYNEAWFVMNGFEIREGTALRRPVSPQQPMYLVHIDTWLNPDPQKIIDLVPEDIRPYVVMNIGLSVGHDGTSRFVRAEYGYEIVKSWLRACAENGMWAMVQPSSGAYSHFPDDDLSIYEELYRDYPNLIGFNYCEQSWGYGDNDPLATRWDDRIEHFARLLELSDRVGGYLVVSWCGNQWVVDINPIAMLKRHPAFAAACSDYTDNYILCEKYTFQTYQSDMESLCLGAWLSGYSGQYGIRYDDTGWTDASGNHANFTMATYGAPFLEHAMLTGQTVFDGPELIMTQCYYENSAVSAGDGYTMRRWNTFPQFDNVSVDLFRKVLDGTARIPSRQEVIDRTKVVIVNEVSSGSNDDKYSSPATLFEGLYRMDGDGNYGGNKYFFKKTGRYPTVPTVYQLDDAPANGFQVQVNKSGYSSRWPSIASKTNEFNGLFPQEYTGDLYAGRHENGWVVYNPYKTNIVASANIPFKYNTCDSMDLAFSQYTAGVVKEYSNSVTFYLGNHDIVLNAGLKTDTITIHGSTSEPTWSYADRGSHQASVVTENWTGGVFTLTVQHNGPLDISIDCAGMATGRLTAYTPATVVEPARPLPYAGPLQHEAECFDYKNISGIVKNGYSGAIRNYTGQGYLSFGTSSSAAVRDTFTLLKSGTYRLETKYAVAGADVGTIDLYVNGTKVADPVFAQTATLSDWAVNTQTVALNAGDNTVELRAAGTGAAAIYFDNIVVVPTDGAGLVIQENETGFAGVDGTIENTEAGYTGDGYANTADSIGTGIDYHMYFGPAVTKAFTFRYACTNDSTAKLIVNGETVASGIQFHSTGSWSTWDLVTVYSRVDASTELADVRIEATSSTGLPHVDYLQVSGGGVDFDPPAAPLGLVAKAGNGKVALDWADSVDSGVASYNVKRSTTPGGPYATIKTGVASSAYTDNTVTNNLAYYYVVSAVNMLEVESGNGNESFAVPGMKYQGSGGIVSMEAENGTVGSRWITTLEAAASNGRYIQVDPQYDNPTGAPAGTTPGYLAVYEFNVPTAGNHRFWYRMFAANANDDSFFWRIDGGSWNMVNGSVGIGTWFSVDHAQVDNLSAGNHVLQIAYRENGAGLDKFVIQLDGLAAPSGTGPAESVQSGVVALPLAPTGLIATSGDAQISLSWNSVAEADHYTVKRSLISGGPYGLVSSTNATSLVDDGLVNGTVYYYVVFAANAGGDGPASAEASAVPSAAIVPAEYHVADLDVSGETNLLLTVSNSVPGHLYQVLSSESLTPPDWQPDGSAQVGNGSNIVFDIPLGESQTNHFYKLDVQRQ